MFGAYAGAYPHDVQYVFEWPSTLPSKPWRMINETMRFWPETRHVPWHIPWPPPWHIYPAHNLAHNQIDSMIDVFQGEGRHITRCTTRFSV